ncbi:MULTISPECIES: AGE family epimerase/isomerase [Micromonospora]|uniref:Mannose-6-phosphate isomerase n=1 Tax=Micromonospora sicca TaxID=2202420 RepID=A0A317D1C3_9ACTN|nr:MULTISPECIES: AGE family epimerase/isomerase [unclassified Micromonospora]MBM0224274.1 AGE family epimerase/isomerase [Micromonospora sp. ATA51]PWR08000.1 mannose-6-phosphate isomerase [Micromonospora sp. 4G51]
MADLTDDGPCWLTSRSHWRWLQSETDRLLRFYERTLIDPSGGYHWLGSDGQPLPGQPKYLWLTARMVHCFAIAELLGRPGAHHIVEHGLAFLDENLRDRRHGGWLWSIGPGGPLDDAKDGYGHAFVLLAASSAVQAGHARAMELLDDVAAVIDSRFWEQKHGLFAERYHRDWSNPEPYRGANSNMHMTEAHLAAAEATGDGIFVDRATSVVQRLIGEFAPHNEWRLPEHYDTAWNMLPDYNRDQPGNQFRPYGSTIGHWLEWAKLLVQLSAVYPAGRSWMTESAARLFDQATIEGFDPADGGFVFTVDWHGQPANLDRYHWVTTEAIGAAAYLHRVTGDRSYERWYRRFWEYAHHRFIDHDLGGWHHQLDRNHHLMDDVWQGKPDLYHALQATLVARVPADQGIAAALRQDRLDEHAETSCCP